MSETGTDGSPIFSVAKLQTMDSYSGYRNKVLDNLGNYVPMIEKEEGTEK